MAKRAYYGDSGPLSLATNIVYASLFGSRSIAGILRNNKPRRCESARKVVDFHHAGNASAVMSRLL